jgi:hypothetical protein
MVLLAMMPCYAMAFVQPQGWGGGRMQGRMQLGSSRFGALACSGSQSRSRRQLLRAAGMAAAGSCASSCSSSDAAAAVEDLRLQSSQRYFQRFPTLFAPLYGDASKQTVRKQVGENIWVLEQTLELGPLQTPLRCVVVRLRDGSLWVHAPLAPTEEFFELVEGIGGGGAKSVAHVIAPTYALEHKVFVKDALLRWPQARLWTAPGQFSFPLQASDELVWGREVSGVLDGSDAERAGSVPWTDEIQFETLTAGTFDVGRSRLTFYETAFFHPASKTLIVTDCLARIPLTLPSDSLSDPQKLLLISKRSTADAFPSDTAEARQVGWEKTALLVSYFFPEHEELDPEAGLGVVTWTEGWHDNFQALAGKLIVPPVVRTLIYAQEPAQVKRWAKRVAARWEFEQIVPAHWEAPIRASPADFEKAFAFLDDETIGAFPANDLARGLKPLADVFVRRK